MLTQKDDCWEAGPAAVFKQQVCNIVSRLQNGWDVGLLSFLKWVLFRSKIAAFNIHGEHPASGAFSMSSEARSFVGSGNEGIWGSAGALTRRA